MERATGRPAEKIVDRNAGGYAAAQRRSTDGLNVSLAKTLSTKGLKVNAPSAAAFRARFASRYATWKGESSSDARTLLEKYSGKRG